MAGYMRHYVESQDLRLRSGGMVLDGGMSPTSEDLTSSESPSHRPSRRPRRRSNGNALARSIEAEIIPRLLLALHEGNPASALPAPAEQAYPTEVVEFARIVMTRDAEQACDYVEKMRDRGQSLETIYLDLIEPAVRRLGDLWNADVCDFVSVTVAVLRLQQVLHQFGLAFRGEIEPRDHGHRALLIPAPGERGSFAHLMFGTFELALAAEFLRRDGWDACVDSSASSGDAIRIVGREWFDVVELSLSSESHIDDLTSGIRLIRKASRNASLGVIVGGSVFKQHPEMVSRVGADVVAADGRQAALQADNLMELLRSR